MCLRPLLTLALVVIDTHVLDTIKTRVDAKMSTTSRFLQNPHALKPLLSPRKLTRRWTHDDSPAWAQRRRVNQTPSLALASAADKAAFLMEHEDNESLTWLIFHLRCFNQVVFLVNTCERCALHPPYEIAPSFTESMLVVRIKVKCYSKEHSHRCMTDRRGSGLCSYNRWLSSFFLMEALASWFAERRLNDKHVNTEMVLVWEIIPQNMYFWHKGHRQNTF